MSTDPTLALQKAVLGTLTSGNALAGLITNRSRADENVSVYDRVPEDAQFPYIKIGEDQNVPDLAECIDGSEIFLTIHVWSREVGFPECKRIANAVTSALHDADLTLDENRLLLIERDNIIFRVEADGLTTHGILIFRALTEPGD